MLATAVHSGNAHNRQVPALTLVRRSGKEQQPRWRAGVSMRFTRKPASRRVETAHQTRQAGNAGGGIVLVGGGHAHLEVLAAFQGRLPAPVTLISQNEHALYSGMVPGIIAGRYRPEDARIDLSRLCAAVGVRFLHATARGVDRTNRLVLLEEEPPLRYDLLSLNVGIVPELGSIAGAPQHGIPLKPIGTLLPRIETLLQAAGRPDGPRRIAMIGGGAGGVEVLLAIAARLRGALRGDGTDALSFLLVTEGALLAGFPPALGQRIRRLFARHGITLVEQAPVTALGAGWLELADGRRLHADAVLVATHAAPPPWFAGLGLSLDAAGFLAVGPTLQSPDDPRIFAAGDCASLIGNPRPKAGVYAVRAGPPLAENLRRAADGSPLRPWQPQRDALALIGTGDGRAIGVRGGLVLEGSLALRLKDWLDRRWMARFKRLAGV